MFSIIEANQYRSWSVEEVYPTIVKKINKHAVCLTAEKSLALHAWSLFIFYSIFELIIFGQVGLPADLDAVSKIVTSYQALLDRMAASDLPETAQYRVDVEKISNYRIQMATDHADDPEMVEELCQCGQVEELVEQAELEMGVLEMYLKERLWEDIDYEVDIDVEQNPDPSKDGEGLDDDN